HLLLAERLGVVDRDHQLGAARGQQPLLDHGGVGGGGGGPQHAVGERRRAPRAPQSEYALFHSSALSLKTSSSVTPWRRSSAGTRSASRSWAWPVTITASARPACGKFASALSG